jgi:hypothetical protein
MNRDATSAALRTTPGWFKSRHSGGQNGCVEVNLSVPGIIGVRDSKLGDASPILAYTQPQWRALLTSARNGTLNHL